MLTALIEALPMLFRLIPGLYELIYFLAHGDEKIKAQVKEKLGQGLEELDDAIERLKKS